MINGAVAHQTLGSVPDPSSAVSSAAAAAAAGASVADLSSTSSATSTSSSSSSSSFSGGGGLLLAAPPTAASSIASQLLHPPPVPLFNPAAMAAQLGIFNPSNILSAMQAAAAHNSLIQQHQRRFEMPSSLLAHLRNSQLVAAAAGGAAGALGMDGRGGGPPSTLDSCSDLCVVCGDKASGRHYGAVSCEGCKGFFKRSIRKQIGYVCRGSKDCQVTKFHRNRCQFCRLRKCLSMGMRSESVQAERRPMNPSSVGSDQKVATLVSSTTSSTHSHNSMPPLQPNPFMNGLLAIAKPEHQLPVDMCGVNYDARSASSPMSAVARPGSVSPDHTSTAAFSIKRESIGEDESGIDMATVVGGSHLAPSESPSSSGAASSLSDDGPIFNVERARFELPIPVAGSAELSMAYICETASRLLFLSVHWMKNVKHAGLKSLTIETTMKSKWCDLFVLGLMQSAGSIGLPHMLEAINAHLATCSRIGQLKQEKYEAVHEQISALLELVARFDSARLGPVEFAYLKLISFTANDLPSSHQSPDARTANVVACQELYEHLLVSWPHSSSSSSGGGSAGTSGEDSSLEDTDAVSTASVSAALERFSRILQLLPTLRWLRSSVLVELFFSGLIGSLSIETVIPFVLKMDVMNVFDSTASGMGGASSGAVVSHGSDSLAPPPASTLTPNPTVMQPPTALAMETK